VIDLDHIDIAAASEAAKRVRDVHPLPKVTRLAEMPAKDVESFLVKLHELVNEQLGVMGAVRRPGRAWVDVHLTGGKWVGQWVDDCPSEAAVSCAYWWEQAVIAAGIGLRDSSTAAEAHQARLDSGDLLALLGDEW